MNRLLFGDNLQWLRDPKNVSAKPEHSVSV
jgi:hypothetical protein